ncbi:hypothetical protein DITRI_Ditri18aG0028700 [Diplodiscus trichospermus]
MLLVVKNGNIGYNVIRIAIKEVKTFKDKLTLIKVTTTIGYGFLNKANSYSVHKNALGAKEKDDVELKSVLTAYGNEIISAYNVVVLNRKRPSILALYCKSYPNFLELPLRELQRVATLFQTILQATTLMKISL